MQTIELKAEARTELGKNRSKQFRKNGLTPAVIYGGSDQPSHITVDSREIAKFYRNHGKNNVLVKIVVNNTEFTAFPKEFTKDALSQQIIHVDFLKIDPTHTIRADIQFKFIGTAPGVKKGGQMMTKLRQVKIKSLPHNVPEFIEVDLSNLEVGQSIRIKDMDTKGLYEIESPGNEIIVFVEALKAADTPAEAAAANK
jgi:large subunit ribosomal protein L25